MGIDLGGGEPGVAQLLLDGPDIGAVIQEVGAIGVTALMGGIDRDLGLRGQGGVEGLQHRFKPPGELGRGEVVLALDAGEDIGAGAREALKEGDALGTEGHQALAFAFREIAELIAALAFDLARLVFGQHSVSRGLLLGNDLVDPDVGSWAVQFHIGPHQAAQFLAAKAGIEGGQDVSSPFVGLGIGDDPLHLGQGEELGWLGRRSLAQGEPGYRVHFADAVIYPGAEDAIETDPDLVLGRAGELDHPTVGKEVVNVVGADKVHLHGAKGGNDVVVGIALVVGIGAVDHLGFFDPEPALGPVLDGPDLFHGDSAIAFQPLVVLLFGASAVLVPGVEGQGGLAALHADAVFPATVGTLAKGAFAAEILRFWGHNRTSFPLRPNPKCGTLMGAKGPWILIGSGSSFDCRSRRSQLRGRFLYGFAAHELGDGDAQGLSEEAELGFLEIHQSGLDLGDGGAVSVADHGGQDGLGEAALQAEELDVFVGGHGGLLSRRNENTKKGG